jgi:hypothetical protein
VENRGLLFIPDISGFTRFVSQTDIEHSRLIIQELLESLINANEIGLEISEIEGDAILFYKYCEEPELEHLYRQVEKMFTEFHRQLGVYDSYRFCWCEACSSAINLTLKIITHYGEFTGYNVKNFNKLIGKDVIVAHQLLKNDIKQHEYWLVTKNLLHDKKPAGLTQWMQWSNGISRTESGELPYSYTQLGPLKKEIGPTPALQLDLSEKTKMISLSREYDTDIITLFHAAGNFNYRSRWREGVKGVEGVTHILPRVGMRYRCLMENGEVAMFYSSYTHDNDNMVEFSETDEKKNSSTFYKLETIGDNKVKLTIDYYIRKDFASQVLFTLLKKKKMVDDLKKSMIRLEDVVRSIKLPG